MVDNKDQEEGPKPFTGEDVVELWKYYNSLDYSITAEEVQEMRLRDKEKKNVNK